MENQNKRDENREKKPRKKGFLYYAREQRNRRRAVGFYRFVRNFFAFVVCAGLVLFFISGMVNQAKTGEQLYQYTMRVGKYIGDQIVGIFTGDGPVKVTDQGVYLKDKEPDGAKDILNNDGTGGEQTTESVTEPEQPAE